METTYAAASATDSVPRPLLRETCCSFPFPPPVNDHCVCSYGRQLILTVQVLHCLLHKFRCDVLNTISASIGRK